MVWVPFWVLRVSETCWPGRCMPTCFDRAAVVGGGVPVDRGDHVTVDDPCLCRWPARIDGGDNDPGSAVGCDCDRSQAETGFRMG
jgi:hypothetical protein